MDTPEMILLLILGVAALGPAAIVAVPRLSTQLELFVSAMRAESLTAWLVGVTSLFNLPLKPSAYVASAQVFGIDALLALWRSFGYTPRFIKIRIMRCSAKVARDFTFTRLRIITERNLEHDPCINALQTFAISLLKCSFNRMLILKKHVREALGR